MLILSRRANEAIVIDTPAGRITMTVTRIQSDCVKLGWDAPKAIEIWRSEIQEQLDAERQGA